MKRMRSYLLITALLLGITALTVAIVSRTRAVDAANTLALEINRQALTQWDAGLVVSNAAPSLIQQGGVDFFPTYFAALRRLGELQEINNINYSLQLPTILWPDSDGSASYTMNAVFSQGQAEVRITLVRQSGRWWFSEYLVLTPMMAS